MKSRKSIALAALLAAAGHASAQTTCQFIGPSGGLWSEPSNWSCGVVPANDGGNTYNVVIPSSITVNFDLGTTTEITGLSLQSGSRINFSDTTLRVLGVAAIENSYLDASGAMGEFLTSPPFTSGNSNRANATEGATIQLGLSTYSWRNDWNTTTVMRADGVGSLIDLSSAGSIDSGSACRSGGPSYYDWIASNGGMLDLSGALSVQGACDDEWQRFRAETGGVIDLSGLTQITGGRNYFDLNGGTFLFDSLSQSNGATFRIRNGESISFPSMVSATSTAFAIDDGGSLVAPALTNFTNSSVSLNPSRTLDAPIFTEIDNARITVAGGEHFAVADSAYRWTNDWNSVDVMVATGAGTLFDLSSLESIDASSACRSGGPSYYNWAVSDGAVMDLSGTETIRGACDDEWLRFRVLSGGAMDLSGLTDVLGGRTYFQLSEGSLSVPNLAAAAGATFVVSTFQTLDFSSLTAATSCSFSIETGGVINAPFLTDFSNSSISLTPSQFFTAPPFEEIDNARLTVTEGRVFEVADDAYRWTRGTGSLTIMQADGPGSLLDLSSLTSVDANACRSGGPSYYSFYATNGGVVDLSGAETVRGACDDEWFRIRATTGGRFDFGSVEHTGGRFRLEADGLGSEIRASGDVVLDRQGGRALLVATDLARWSIGGDLIHGLTSESDHNTSGGSVELVGDDNQRFEIGGVDLGIPDSTLPSNFQWGAMVVGQDGQQTTVLLIDSVDNGNRGQDSEPEALYLTGFPQGDDGLQIRGGSTLILNDLQVYVGTVNGWVHINTLFGPEDFRIPYDGGFIQIRECIADWDGDGGTDTQDFLAFLNAWAAGDPTADLNGDGTVNTLDFIEFLNLWSSGCA